jgi:hypothetical protein
VGGRGDSQGSEHHCTREDEGAPAQLHASTLSSFAPSPRPWVPDPASSVRIRQFRESGRLAPAYSAPAPTKIRTTRPSAKSKNVPP